MNYIMERKGKMSKFTRALEKIQEQREKGDGQCPAANYLKKTDGDAPHWESGIPSLRNATPDKRIVSYHFPNSLITEQYRMLRTNLTTHLVQSPAKVILISSSVRGEGKSITAVNLAYSLVETGENKVVLVDADLRRGKIAEYLGVARERLGLSDLLCKDIAIKEVMVRNSVPNLFIIPRGPAPKNPSELVASHKISAVIAELRSRFDYVIIDSPPIMSVADPSILAREVDGLLMVIQSRGTPRNVVSQANLLFHQAGVKILGYVLTNVEYQSADYKNYYYQYYTQDSEQKSAFKSRTDFFFKKLRFQIDRTEQGLNRWWDKRRRKQAKKEKQEKELQKQL